MMSQMWKIGALAAIGLSVAAGVAAQQPPAQQPPAPTTAQQPAAPAAAPAAADQVVITGCVQRTAQLPVGTSGAIGAADAAKFILTKASPAGDSQAAAAPKTYRLDADDAALTAHVGHKVEITGTLDAAKPAAPVTGDPAPPAASASKLKVTSVKMVAASCAE